MLQSGVDTEEEYQVLGTALQIRRAMQGDENFELDSLPVQSSV